ncbi:MAG: hypothetical protein WAN20_09990 [Pseudonocardiaceae bacterium]
MPQRRPATIQLNASDTAELLELLGFLSGWLEGRDADLLDNSLNRFVGNQAYDLTALQADLARFAFLLGSDGERLLRPPHQ